MAPIKKRATMRTKAAASAKPKPAFAPSRGTGGEGPELHASASEFSNTKRDKRAIKHNALVSRIEKSSKKPLKRRRPGKKLVAGLEGLVDALPDLDGGEWEADDDDNEVMAEGGGGGGGGVGGMVRVRRNPKMEMKTVKTRPGAAKRKAKLEEREMERFRANMAGMTPTVRAQGGEAQTGDRWAALRGFIGQTLEQNSAFGKKA